jgi:hypothetical protein
LLWDDTIGNVLGRMIMRTFGFIIVVVSGCSVFGCARNTCELHAPSTTLVPYLQEMHQKNGKRLLAKDVRSVLYVVDREAYEPSSIPLLFPETVRGTFPPSDDNAIRGEYYLLAGPSADERRTPAVVTEIVIFRNGEVTFGYAITAWNSHACRWGTAKYIGAGG